MNSLAALVVTLLLASGSEPVEIPADPARGLTAVPLPVTRDTEPAVAEALAAASGVLSRTLAEPAAPPMALAAAYGRLGMIAQAHQFGDTARAAYHAALVLAPGQPLWTYALGLCAEASGDLDGAVEAYRAVLDRVPSDGPARFHLGEALRGLGRVDDAELELSRALESPGVRAAALASLGQLAADRGDDARAVARLEAALAAEPRAARLHYPLALAYRRLGNGAAAERHLALRGEAGVAPADPFAVQLQELAAGESISLLRGRLAYQAGDFPGALAQFDRALAAAPASAAARIGRAAALVGAGRTDEATAELERVLAAEPEQATARFNLATLALSRGDLAEAEKHFARYLERFPEDREALLAQGEVLRRRGDAERALDHFDRAARLPGPGGPEGLLGRAQVLVDASRWAEAEEALARAAASWPLDARVATARARFDAARPSLP